MTLSRRRSTVAPALPSVDAPPMPRYADRASHTSAGVSAAVVATPSSSMAYMCSGFFARSARRPRMAPPAPRPPMKTASTAADAAVDAPKMRRSSRNHAT